MDWYTLVMTLVKCFIYCFAFWYYSDIFKKRRLLSTIIVCLAALPFDTFSFFLSEGILGDMPDVIYYFMCYFPIELLVLPFLCWKKAFNSYVLYYIIIILSFIPCMPVFMLTTIIKENCSILAVWVIADLIEVTIQSIIIYLILRYGKKIVDLLRDLSEYLCFMFILLVKVGLARAYVGTANYSNMNSEEQVQYSWVLVLAAMSPAIILAISVFLEGCKKREIIKLQKKRLISQYNAYYEKLKVIETSVGKIRHDLVNHLSVLKTLKSNSQDESWTEYKTRLLMGISEVKTEMDQLNDEMNQQNISALSSGSKKISRYDIIALSFAFLMNVYSWLMATKYDDITWNAVYAVLLLIPVGLFFGFIGRRNKDEMKKISSQSDHVLELSRENENVSQVLEQIQNRIAEEAQSTEYEQASDLLKICDECFRSEYTGNFVLNAILAGKRKLCESLKIQFDCQVTIPDNIAIRDTELTGLFANLLDNSIEASRQSGQATPRIGVYTDVQGEYLIIQITNSKSPKLKPLKHNMKTTKVSEGHGIGMSIVRDIVKKNKGVIEMQDQKDSFNTTIMITC